MTLIREAVTPRELDDVRSLMRAFLAWHRERHVEDLALVERYFDRRAFDRELEELPGQYARPQGRFRRLPGRRSGRLRGIAGPGRWHLRDGAPQTHQLAGRNLDYLRLAVSNTVRARGS